MTIIVCPLSYVHHQIGQYNPARIISLLDPSTPFPDSGAAYLDRHLKLEIHDVGDPLDAEIPPDALHLTQIIDFVKPWDRSAPILIHCYAGISRSTATAFITACAHNPDADEMEIAQTLRRASPTARPNPLMVALGDKALGREGRMSEALTSVWRNARMLATMEAEPFTIPSRYEPAKKPRK